MIDIETLGFDKWFKDKIDLSKTTNCKIARVINVSKNSFVVSNGTRIFYIKHLPFPYFLLRKALFLVKNAYISCENYRNENYRKWKEILLSSAAL